MDIRYLREFVALERVRNYTQTAEFLYTTEATLSRHIKALEKELGQPLFLRTSRRIELTQFGRSFLTYAQRITEAWEECSTHLLSPDTHISERLMIGIFGSIARYEVIQSALQDLSARYPECAVGTIQGDLAQQKEKLLRREYDLAIVRESTAFTDDVFGRVMLLKEPLCVIVPKDDQLAQKPEVGVCALRERSVMLPSEYMLSHRLFVSLCRNNGFEPKVRSLLREREFIENFISVGNGVTVMCRNMAERFVDPQDQVVRQISPPTLEYVNLLYLKNRQIPEMVQHAIQCFEIAVANTAARTEGR